MYAFCENIHYLYFSAPYYMKATICEKALCHCFVKLFHFPFLQSGVVNLYPTLVDLLVFLHSWNSFVLPNDWEKWEGEDWECMVAFPALTVKSLLQVELLLK